MLEPRQKQLKPAEPASVGAQLWHRTEPRGNGTDQ